jgi:hypothetical protein
MVANRPERDESDRTTLIVCPFALLDQWKLEIESKCTPNLFKIVRLFSRGSLPRPLIADLHIASGHLSPG